MAISRRDILRLGVSYGTGSINFGNDSIVYDRELRKLPNNTVFAEFIEELENAQKRLEEELAEAEEQARLAAEAEEEAPEAAEEPSEPITEKDAESDGETPEVEAEEPAEEPDELEEEPHINPFADVIAKANDFIDLCGRMALSGLYQQTRGIVASLVAEEFPAVEDIETMKEDYQKLMEYLQTH